MCHINGTGINNSSDKLKHKISTLIQGFFRFYLITACIDTPGMVFRKFIAPIRNEEIRRMAVFNESVIIKMHKGMLR